jgi:hypothetical protein
VGRARAANELTEEQWDPVSKQPMFKSGAVRIKKVQSRGPHVEIKAKEMHSQSVTNVADAKPNAQNIQDRYRRKRFIDDWLETIHLSCLICRISDICLPTNTPLTIFGKVSLVRWAFFGVVVLLFHFNACPLLNYICDSIDI